MLKKVKETIRNYKMIKKNNQIILYFSGGNDSTVLLDLLCKIRDEFEFELLPIMMRYPKVALDTNSCLE